ncbi:hypothetical protein ACFYQ5_19695 [Streptomyces sp. NPDC005794]|uniref:hypothetical protein n=1 Tax=Streptomyces sp. NPDC005794 TaxID=3364733 RepID=UPI0036982FE7
MNRCRFPTVRWSRRPAVAEPDPLDLEIVDLHRRTTGWDGRQRTGPCEADDAVHGPLASGRTTLAELLDRGL